MEHKLKFYETGGRQVKRVVYVQGLRYRISRQFPVQDAEEELEMNSTKRLKLTEKGGGSRVENEKSKDKGKSGLEGARLKTLHTGLVGCLATHSE